MEEVEFEIDDETLAKLKKIATEQHTTPEELISKIFTDWTNKEVTKQSK